MTACLEMLFSYGRRPRIAGPAISIFREWAAPPPVLISVFRYILTVDAPGDGVTFLSDAENHSVCANRRDSAFSISGSG